MTWTTELPTQSGWYWHKPDPQAEPTICLIDTRTPPGDVYSIGDSLNGYLDSLGGLWSGPIKPPAREENKS